MSEDTAALDALRRLVRHMSNESSYIGMAWDFECIRQDLQPKGRKLVPVEPSEEWLEVGRKAIEDELVQWRDNRLSQPYLGNGLVIKERDGSGGDLIRFGPETALRIGYKAMLADPK